MEPSTQPTAPAKDAPQSVISPLCTKKPANGIITSEGSGMQADSMPIRRIIPPNPIDEMMFIIQIASAAMIFSSI